MKKKLILSAAVAVLLVVGNSTAVFANEECIKPEVEISGVFKSFERYPSVNADCLDKEKKRRVECLGGKASFWALIVSDEDKSLVYPELKPKEEIDWDYLKNLRGKRVRFCALPTETIEIIGLKASVLSYKVEDYSAFKLDNHLNKNQCEQDFSNWESGQDIPQSCYNHLDELLADAGMKEDEAFYEYAYRIKHDDRFTIHFEIKRQLSDICHSDRRIKEVVPECELVMQHTKKMYFLSDDKKRAYALALSDKAAPTPIENQTGTYCYLDLIHWRVTDALPKCVEHEIKVLGGEVQNIAYQFEGISNEEARTLSVLETLCSLQPLGRDQDLVTVPAGCGAKNNYAVHIGAIDLNAKGELLPKPEELTP